MYTEMLDSKSVQRVKEEDYREYFDSTTIGILHLDKHMHIKNLNRELERICGLERNKILGEKALAVFSDYGDGFLKLLSVATYEELYSVNLKLHIHDQYLYIHIDVITLQDSDANFGGMIIIMQDMSAVRAAIKQIQTTQMLMSLGELAAGVAHHVRTPLTIISGYLQVMVGRLENDQYTVRRDILESLLDEVSYINDVVKELVMFAKPAVLKQPGRSVNRIVEEAMLLVFKELGGEQITIRKQLAKELPVIEADDNLLKQACVNIMQNAMEAMPADGTLTVKTWLHAELNMLVVAIADTGAGVAPEILSQVFEPFYTTKLDRMGLGLPIAHRIIHEHGGFINVNPDDNAGTEVHIYLPLFSNETRGLSVVHQQILNLQ